MMKKVILLVVFLWTSVAYASLQSELLKDIQGESAQVWDIYVGNNFSDTFVPKKGGIKVCKTENKVIVGFYLSDDNISFYSQTFSDGKRKPIGFEFDIIDHSHVFSNEDIVSIETSFDDSIRYDENNMLDSHGAYGINIKNPTHLTANTWHFATINFSDHVDVNLAEFEVQVQLVGDMRKLKEDYESVYEEYSPKAKSELFGWFTVLGGHEDVDGNNFFNLRMPHQAFHKNKFFGWPEGTKKGYDRFLWNAEKEVGDYKPYSCGFGSDPWDDDSTGNGDSNNDNTDNTYHPPQEETLNPGHPGGGGFNDMKIKTVTMSKGAHSERHKTLHQKPGEKFYAYAKLDNDGSATAYDFKLKFYIDGGKRNFDRDHEDYQGSIRINEYNPDAQIRYAKELTAPNEPGIHWVYTCITSIDNDQDEENNCSDEDEREECGKLIINGPYENPDTSSPPTGKSWDELTQGEKAAVLQIIFD